jgi:hypothetical protein
LGHVFWAVAPDSLPYAPILIVCLGSKFLRKSQTEPVGVTAYIGSPATMTLYPVEFAAAELLVPAKVMVEFCFYRFVAAFSATPFAAPDNLGA